MAVGRTAKPSPLVDDRPWGNFRQYTCNEPSTIKIITVEADQQLSLQRHAHRDELWIAMDDGLIVELGERGAVRAAAGDEFWIPRGTLHRVGAGATTCRFVEICFGDFDESDIERLDDRYGRGG